MLGAPGFHTFTHRLDPREEYGPRIAVVYKPPGKILDGALEELLQLLAKGPVQPDAVVFLEVSGDHGQGLDAELLREAVQVEWLRFRGRAALLRASLNPANGQLKVKTLKSAKGVDASRFRGAIESGLPTVLQSGLASVFRSDDVILRAPAGYAYQKPSGKRETFFLKPDVALSSSASVAYVGFSVFMRLGAKRLAAARELRYLYVDTMSVAPVAYALRDLILLAQPGGSPALVESFHSYGGMDEIPRPLPQTALCLISASTSMAMHERWLVDKGANADEVVTLLTAKPVAPKHAAGALFEIDRPKLAASEGPPQLCILLDGENFLPSQEPAKKVLLSESVHGTAEVGVFREFSGTKVFDAWRRPFGITGGMPRAVFVDGVQLVRSDEFKKWLPTQIAHRVRAATKVILHQEDMASRELAELIKAECMRQFQMQDLRVVSAADVDGLENLAEGGILVCAAVVGKGAKLLQISQALRDKHRGPRLYVIGMQVTETRDEVTALPLNLQHAKPVKFEVAVFRSMAVGRQLFRSFQAEMDAFYPSSVDFKKVPAVLRRRAQALGSVDAVGSLALLPCGSKCDGAMDLRPGYAYWSGKYDAGPHHAGVLGTVGVLLQRAREDDKVASDKRLSSTSFRHVLLDPENFARFNDGVIQAALLRNAFPSELDYRMDTAASSYVKAILLRMFARIGSHASEGILEFLLAIALRRLLLEESHEAEILAAARATGKPREIQAAIDFILKPFDKKEAPHVLPF
ncbi:hypothetical protein [Paucibacter sp. M5-1]|uniref:hypothetical protein n=1 Tax=Paucibacter sp. M5-1 TaxID=3015998 RepID=UPI0022B8AE19|nr:hypothetical protein [Paucibacter sp. M5-1]MCZ7884616.1 hypothetical protein [Paucibacter sp. M5-1]